MKSSTGTTIDSYIDWLRDEVDGKQWGHVSIEFTLCSGQVTKVIKRSEDTEKLSKVDK